MRLAATLGQKLRRGKLANAFHVGDVYLQGWPGLETAERARTALRVLVDAGWVRASRRGGGQYLINPTIFAGATTLAVGHFHNDDTLDIVTGGFDPLDFSGTKDSVSILTNNTPR